MVAAALPLQEAGLDTSQPSGHEESAPNVKVPSHPPLPDGVNVAVSGEEFVIQFRSSIALKQISPGLLLPALEEYSHPLLVHVPQIQGSLVAGHSSAVAVVGAGVGFGVTGDLVGDDVGAGPPPPDRVGDVVFGAPAVTGAGVDGWELGSDEGSDEG
jgi:hypothetical protein